jgi:hypothetical protein
VLLLLLLLLLLLAATWRAMHIEWMRVAAAGV